jgi:RNA-directed DNA polymerase
MTVKSLKGCTEEWKNLPWKKFQKILFNLQHRIYKAAQKGDINLIKKLQSLLIGSKCSKYLSVREVTKFSDNKSMFGMKSFLSLDAKKKLVLVEKLDSIQILKQQRSYFSLIKKTRLNNPEYDVLVLRDKAIQCLIKYAFEPLYEYSIYRNSNGYHIKKFELKIQKFVWENLKSNLIFLGLNSKNSLYEINSEKLLSLINVSRSFLKHEFSKKRIYIKGKTRNLLSPLLCNLFIPRKKDFYNEKVGNRIIQEKEFSSGKNIFFIIKFNEVQYYLFQKVGVFFYFRNLSSQTMKIKLTSLKDNISFLDWPLKINGKNKNNFYFNSQDINKIVKAKVKAKIKDSRYSLKTRIQMVTSIYNNCWELYQLCDTRKLRNTFRSLKAWSYKFIRKNSNQSKEQTSHLINSIFNQC